MPLARSSSPRCVLDHFDQDRRDVVSSPSLVGEVNQALYDLISISFAEDLYLSCLKISMA